MIETNLLQEHAR